MLKVSIQISVCEMLDSVSDVNREVYFLGDLNIEWFSSSCLLKRKLLIVTSAYNLVPVINQSTRVFAWNFLPAHIAQINSIPGLKKKIKQHLAAQCLFPISNQINLYLSHAPNTTSVDFTVKFLLSSP